MPDFDSFDNIYDELLTASNDEIKRRSRNAVKAACDSTRLDTGRLIGNWDINYGNEEAKDRNPIEAGGRKTETRRDTNKSRSLDRSDNDIDKFDIIKNNKIHIVNATEYAEEWDPIDGMTRNAEVEFLKD